MTCALREDIVPTLSRLGREQRWSTIVAALPTGAEASRLALALRTDSRLARHLRLSSVIAAVAEQELVEDLLGDSLLRERGWHTNPADDRGVGEVACAQIELADVVALAGDPGAEGADLVRALVRPAGSIVTGFDQLDGTELVARRHDDKVAAAWRSPILDREPPPLRTGAVWRLCLTSDRPFHPERLLDQIERLGSGRHRSRGCFWVPTRPHTAVEWSGAGGQLSIGNHCDWGRRTPLTRLLLTGVGPRPDALVSAFEDLLVTAAEARWGSTGCELLEDGLEPWLGDIRDVA